MDNLNFKHWLEAIPQPNPELADPTLGATAAAAKVAAQTAIKKGQNPIVAAQGAVLKSKIPVNKLGQIMPTDPNNPNAQKPVM